MDGTPSEGAFALTSVPRLDGVPFLDLGKGWALAADRNQWILKKARNWRGTIKWQPFSYVGCDKAVLMRVMREQGLPLPPDASDAVNRFFATSPEKFLHWRDEINAREREAHSG